MTYRISVFGAGKDIREQREEERRTFVDEFQKLVMGMETRAQLSETRGPHTQRHFAKITERDLLRLDEINRLLQRKPEIKQKPLTLRRFFGYNRDRISHALWHALGHPFHHEDHPSWSGAGGDRHVS